MKVVKIYLISADVLEQISLLEMLVKLSITVKFSLVKYSVMTSLYLSGIILMFTSASKSRLSNWPEKID